MVIDHVIDLVADALERRPDLAARIAHLLNLRPQWVPVAELAKEIGAPVRAILLAGKRGRQVAPIA